MVGRKDELAIDHELVDAVGKDMAEFATALGEMRTYAHTDDGLTAEKFGPIAARTGVSQTYTQLREILRGVLDKAGPAVDALAQTLAGAQQKTVEADQEIARNIAKADGGAGSVR
ncbi:MAG: hypothetical protein ABW224_20515 [Kibdelosporangium sp.]